MGTLNIDSGGSFGIAPSLYNLQGGQLTANTINLNIGILNLNGGTLGFGTLNQTSGRVVVNSAAAVQSGNLTLGTGGTGINYNLTGGVLVSPTITVNPGSSFIATYGSVTATTVNQNGGSVTWPSISMCGTDRPLYNFTSVPNYNYTSGAFSVTN